MPNGVKIFYTTKSNTMKKLLLLLLIAPMIGNSQLLDLPVSEVIVTNQFNHYYQVPQGKVAQLVSSSFNEVYMFYAE